MVGCWSIECTSTSQLLLQLMMVTGRGGEVNEAERMRKVATSLGAQSQLKSGRS